MYLPAARSHAEAICSEDRLRFESVFSGSHQARQRRGEEHRNDESARGDRAEHFGQQLQTFVRKNVVTEPRARERMARLSPFVITERRDARGSFRKLSWFFRDDRNQEALVHRRENTGIPACFLLVEYPLSKSIAHVVETIHFLDVEAGFAQFGYERV